MVRYQILVLNLLFKYQKVKFLMSFWNPFEIRRCQPYWISKFLNIQKNQIPHMYNCTRLFSYKKDLKRKFWNWTLNFLNLEFLLQNWTCLGSGYVVIVYHHLSKYDDYKLLEIESLCIVILTLRTDILGRFCKVFHSLLI